MSTWRRKAIEAFPSRKKDVEAAEGVQDAWIYLWLTFEDAHKQQDEKLIRAAYGFASWCVGSKNGEVREAAVMWFYHELPSNPLVWKHAAQYLSRNDFLDWKGIFMCCRSQEEFKQLESQFMIEAGKIERQRKKRRGRREAE